MKTEHRSKQLQIISDMHTVWVNDNTGCCVGRFSKYGIDIHKTGPDQVETSEQCLDCKAGQTTILDWRHFQHAMKQHYFTDVSDSHMPAFLSGTAHEKAKENAA